MATSVAVTKSEWTPIVQNSGAAAVYVTVLANSSTLFLWRRETSLPQASSFDGFPVFGSDGPFEVPAPTHQDALPFQPTVVSITSPSVRPTADRGGRTAPTRQPTATRRSRGWWAVKATARWQLATPTLPMAVCLPVLGPCSWTRARRAAARRLALATPTQPTRPLKRSQARSVAAQTARSGHMTRPRPRKPAATPTDTLFA